MTPHSLISWHLGVPVSTKNVRRVAECAAGLAFPGIILRASKADGTRGREEKTYNRSLRLL